MGQPYFADIVEVVTFFIKTLKIKSLKTQEKLKELKTLYQMQSIHVFLDIAKFADFR